MFIIRETKPEQLYHLRNGYLSQLPYFQEFYIELLIEEAAYYSISEGDQFIGYTICSKDYILLEFYLKPEYLQECSRVFEHILSELSIKQIYCKSFDTQLMQLCSDLPYSQKTIGCLYRDFTDTPDFFENYCAVKVAEYSDLDFLLQQEEGLYETQKELERFIRGGNVFMYFKDNQLIGCGFLTRVHLDFNFFDIGMWVHPNFRQQGIAIRIISHLKHICLKNNWIPIAGCEVSNYASQRTLERNGFISRHSLIAIQR